MKGQRHLGGEFKTKSAQSALLAHSVKQNNQSVEVAAVSQQPQYMQVSFAGIAVYYTRLWESKAMSGLLFGNEGSHPKLFAKLSLQLPLAE